MTRWLGFGLCVLSLAVSGCPSGDDDANANGGKGDGSEMLGDGGVATDAGSDGKGGKAGSGGKAGGGAGEKDEGEKDAGAALPGEDDVVAIDLGSELGMPQAKAKWTVFVYGHADHNLSNSFLTDLVEMAKAQISDDVNVIVLADFDSSQEIADTGEHFPSGAEWMRIPGNEAEPITLATEEELDFDDPSVLAGAIATAFERFPAEHHAVILWDHGGSWNGGFGSDTQNGTREHPTPMTPLQVSQAVRSGAREAKLGIDSPLDLFSFDTCLMAGAEVAWDFRNITKVYIANAEIDYGDGWDYEHFLTHLSQHPDDPLNDLATKEVELWDAHHVNATFNDSLLRSHVALDMSAMPAVATKLSGLVDTWRSSTTLNDVQLGRAAYFSQPPYMNQLENPQAAPELRDLGQFLRALQGAGDSALASAAGSVHGALQDLIIARSQGSLRSSAKQLGLHIELPLPAYVDNALFDAYASRAGSWSTASRWGEALKALRDADDSGAPALTATISNDTNPDATHLPTVSFNVSSADVADVDVELAELDPSNQDQLVFFGVVAKSPIDAATDYEFAWNGQLTALPDGQNGQQAIFVSVWEDVGPDASGSTALVLATFGLVETSDGASALGALLYQDGDASTGLLTLLDPPVTLTLAEVARDLPGSTFTPVLVGVSTTTEEQTLIPGSPIPLDADTIPITQGPAAAGRFALVTNVNDVFGNAAADVQVVDVTTPIQ